MRLGGRPRRGRRLQLEAHRSASSSATRAEVPASRSLTSSAVATDSPCSAANEPASGPRSRHDHRAGGHDERRLRRPLQDPAADEVVQPRGPGQDDAGPDDRAARDEDPLEQRAAGPHERVVLDDDRSGAGRLEDPADGDAGGEMDARPDLGARADEHVRIDHRLAARPTPRRSGTTAA